VPKNRVFFLINAGARLHLKLWGFLGNFVFLRVRIQGFFAK
jgi:hypothetical protein